jgi:hypothetical protein
MKKQALFLIFLIGKGLAAGDELKFQAPNFTDPYFRLIFQWESKAENLHIKDLYLNGKKQDNFFLFQKGINVDISKPLNPGIYDIHIDYAWKNNKKYKIAMNYGLENSSNMSKFEIMGTSPANGGVPLDKEGFYRVYRTEELVGLERKGEIVPAVFSVKKSEFKEKSFTLLVGETQIEYQVLDVQETNPPENKAKEYPSALTYKIVFPLDLKPYEKKKILVLKGNQKSPNRRGFNISGSGVGKTVKSKRISMEFHPNSGQINILEFLEEKKKLHNEVGVLHWNPGVFIPGIAWDHSFNWKSPPTYAEKIGKFLYINSRRGPLQKIKDVNLEIRYTLGIDTPYFISEALLRVNKGLSVQAIRNDEFVLFKELFDTYVYKDHRGKIVEAPLQERAGYPDGFVHAAPGNLEWVGLLSKKNNYGFFSLRIEYSNLSLSPPGNWLNKEGTYFYAPSKGKYVYWVRPLLYTWSEYPTRNLLTFVPEGSIFYEKNAYILLTLDKDYTGKLDNYLKKLKNPIRIY